MKKVVCLTLTIFLFITSFSIGHAKKICNEEPIFIPTNFDGNTLYVGGNGENNYSTIQNAIDNSSNGDTIYVYNGTYFENLIINKSINLLGENCVTTTIDGGNIGNTTYIKSENVSISGFTITNGSGKPWYYAGIRLTGSNNQIFGNIIKNNKLGIFGKRVTNISIFENKFFNDGVTFSLYDSGTGSTPYFEKYFIHNIYDNKVNSKELYYLKNQNNFVIPKDAGQLIAINCNNLTANNLNLSNADYGCILVNCSNCLLEHSNITYGDGMLWLINSRKNIIQYNQISHNFEGVCIDTGSIKNEIRYNNITYNSALGIIIEDKSNFNKICKNNFIKNNQKDPLKKQAYFSFCFLNIWKKNYWNRPKVLPKIIFGKFRENLLWFNIDFRPALEKYCI